MALRSKIDARSTDTDTESSAGTRDDHSSGGMHVVRETIPAGTSERHAEGHDVVRETALVSQPLPLGAVVRVLFGLIWAADAYFKWQPSFLNGVLDVMHDGSMGQPGWLMPWFNFTHVIIALQPTLEAYGIAIIETAIAITLLLGVARRVIYLGGAVWSLLIWATAEGFGRESSGIATDIGAGIIYSMVFLALLAADRCAGTRPYSLDAVIEQRLPWWRRIAEGRR